MFLKRKMNGSTNSYSDKILQIKEKISQADAVIIGAGAGLSTSAGFVYTGERFKKYFSDFKEKYGFSDMYSGGFYPYKTLEKHWGYWCRYIYINRYVDAPKQVYQNLYELVKEKDYFVLIVEDNGAGMSRERLEAVREGMNQKSQTEKDIYALYNVNERIRLNFGQKYGLSIDSILGEGTTVQVMLPFTYQERENK